VEVSLGYIDRPCFKNQKQILKSCGGGDFCNCLSC
jgi:hypothetical protein